MVLAFLRSTCGIRLRGGGVRVDPSHCCAGRFEVRPLFLLGSLMGGNGLSGRRI